jgi:hypothetical protein
MFWALIFLSLVENVALGTFTTAIKGSDLLSVCTCVVSKKCVNLSWIDYKQIKK